MNDIPDHVRDFAVSYGSDYKLARAAAECGMSTATAYKWLKDLRVQTIVREAARRSSERAGVSHDMVLRQLMAILNTDVTEFLEFDDEGRFYKLKLNPDELTWEQKACIKSIKPTKFGLAIELHDKMAAIEKAGKYLGMFTDKVEVSGPKGAALPINLTMTPQEAAEMYQRELKGG